MGHNSRLLYWAINLLIAPETLNPVRSLTSANTRKKERRKEARESRIIRAKLIEDFIACQKI
jgi:hypothetical protein